MHELNSILSTWASCEADGGEGLLATVVDVQGSAYRRPGARMLITSDGRRVGSISGGCLEGEVVKKGWWWTEHGAPVLRAYDTHSDDEPHWEYRLGCNGVVRLLVERLGTREAKSAIAFLNRCRMERKPGVMATVISSPSPDAARAGDRWFLETDGSTSGNIVDMMVRDWTEAEAGFALFEKRSRLLTVPHSLGPVEVFVEVISPPLPLLVFGSGPDVLPLVRLAKEVGWHVTVADARSSRAQAPRFPEADKVVRTSSEEPLDNLTIEPDSVAVVMNHDYFLDRSVLRALLVHPPAFIGMLGPRLRTERMLRELSIAGIPGFLHAPVGLDIGAETPESIALSIVAEIQAVRAGRTANLLCSVATEEQTSSEDSQSLALCS